MVATATRNLTPLIQSLASFMMRNPALGAVMAAIEQFAQSIIGMISNLVRKLVDILEVVFGTILILTATARVTQL